MATLLAKVEDKQTVSKNIATFQITKYFYCNVLFQLLSQTNLYGDTPLHVACYHGKLVIVKMLMRAGDNTMLLELENVFNETFFQASCTAGKSLELVAYLLRQPGIKPNRQSKDGHTALHSACYHGHLRIVQYLLDNGADQSLTAKAIETSSGEGKIQ